MLQIWEASTRFRPPRGQKPPKRTQKSNTNSKKHDTLTKDPKQQGSGGQVWGQHSGGNKIARHGLWVRLGTSWFWGQVAFHKGLPNGVHIESYGLWPTWVLEAHRQFEYQGIAGLPHPKQKTTKFTPQSYCHQIIPRNLKINEISRNPPGSKGKKR